MGNAITPLRNPHAHSLFIMPGLARSSHPSSKLFDLIADGLKKMSDTEKKETLRKVNGIFEMRIKNSSGVIESWVIDMKKNGEVVKLEKDTARRNDWDGGRYVSTIGRRKAERPEGLHDRQA